MVVGVGVEVGVEVGVRVGVGVDDERSPFKGKGEALPILGERSSEVNVSVGVKVGVGVAKAIGAGGCHPKAMMTMTIKVIALPITVAKLSFLSSSLQSVTLRLAHSPYC